MRLTSGAAAVAAACVVLASTFGPAHAATRVDRTWHDPRGDVTHCPGGTAVAKAAADLRSFSVGYHPGRSNVVNINLVVAHLPADSSRAGGSYRIYLKGDESLVIWVGRNGSLAVDFEWPDYTGGYGSTRVVLASSRYDAANNLIHVGIRTTRLKQVGVVLPFTGIGVNDWVGGGPWCTDVIHDVRFTIG